MQNKPKFKVGDDAIYIPEDKYDDYFCLFTGKISEVLKERQAVYRIGVSNNRVSEKELYTKEEALIKLQEFLNAK